MLGFLASLPLFIIWAIAEQVDQGVDYMPNWPKGGRSLGMLLRHHHLEFYNLMVPMIILLYAVQIALIAFGVLNPATGVTVVAVVPIAVSTFIIDTELNKGMIYGLVGITMFQILLVVGQAI